MFAIVWNTLFLALDYFGEIVINKSLIHKAGFGNRAIPTYVGEWIISHFIGDNQELSDDNRERIADFVQKYVPEKGKKEVVWVKKLMDFMQKLVEEG
mgnify:CR=1 FL=1